jgi:beta-glucosidase
MSRLNALPVAALVIFSACSDNKKEAVVVDSGVPDRPEPQDVAVVPPDAPINHDASTADADPCLPNAATAQPVLGFAPARPLGKGGTPYTYATTTATNAPTAEVPYAQKQAITSNGLQFRDLNGNGTLERYEDWRYSDLCRAKDLVARMTVPQKVGLMSEGSTIGSGAADGILTQDAVNSMARDLRRQALIRLNGDLTAAQYATYLNNVQAIAEGMPLGIPFVITADPVHFIGQATNATTGVQSLSITKNVSSWPYPMGMGAINDPSLTFQYGDTVRREFKALGFRWQLGPMADLATEPRWARVQNVFGENGPHVAKHVKACIEGFQGGRGGPGLRGAIAATVKHFPGAGTDTDGMDSHSAPGKYNIFPGGMFTYHQIPFKAAFEASPAALMPCYSIFKVIEFDPEQVGAAHSPTLITTYLKHTLGFDGMITGDWGAAGSSGWGLELSTVAEKAASFVKAGSHQLGSDSSANIQAAFDQSLLTAADIDGAAEKILEMSFKLGIFENPYSDPAAATEEVRSQQNMQAGLDAQKKAIVLLKNADMKTASGVSTCGTNAACLPISATRFTDKATGTAGAPELGEFAADANGNGTIEVYYDGLTDGLAGTDPYSTWLMDYDYAAAAAGAPGTAGYALPIATSKTAETADIAILRITARKGTYFGLDAGVPLSFDGPFPGLSTDSNLAAAIKDRNKVIDLFRIRDGYTMADGTVVAPVNPSLKIVLVVHLDRPAILKPWVNGLTTLNEVSGADSYPLVSDEANVNQTVVTSETASAKAHVGADTILVEFGAYDRAVLDFMFKKNAITGWTYGAARMPVELPSNDAAVAAQFEDVPSDSANPTFTLGAGITLPTN